MGQQLDYLYNGFQLLQDDRFFKLGQDSVLLSAFVRLGRGLRVCDLGCGNGALSLLLLAGRQDITVHGVELQQEIYDLALTNKAHNQLGDCFTLFHHDFTNLGNLLTKGSYDLVVSNPPYFKENSGISAAGSEKKLAREELGCTLEALCKTAASLLKFGGKFALVHKPQRLAEIIFAMKQAGIEPKRLRMVQKNPTTAPSVILIEGRKGSRVGLEIDRPLLLTHENGGESTELKEIYHR